MKGDSSPSLIRGLRKLDSGEILKPGDYYTVHCLKDGVKRLGVEQTRLSDGVTRVRANHERGLDYYRVSSDLTDHVWPIPQSQGGPAEGQGVLLCPGLSCALIKQMIAYNLSLSTRSDELSVMRKQLTPFLVDSQERVTPLLSEATVESSHLHKWGVYQYTRKDGRTHPNITGALWVTGQASMWVHSDGTVSKMYPDSNGESTALGHIALLLTPRASSPSLKEVA